MTDAEIQVKALAQRLGLQVAFCAAEVGVVTFWWAQRPVALELVLALALAFVLDLVLTLALEVFSKTSSKSWMV